MRYLWGILMIGLGSYCYGGTYTFPFEMVNGLVIIEATIDNKHGKFILDTGSSDILIHASEAMTTSDIEYFETLAGSLVAHASGGAQMQLGSYHKEVAILYTADLGAIRSFAGIDILGIVGSQVFMPHCITIDYDHRILDISTTRQDLPHGLSHHLPFTTDYGVLLTRVQIGTASYYFIIDSGATSHHIDKDICIAHPFGYRLLDDIHRVITASGTTTSTNKVSLKEVTLGTQPLYDVTCMISDFSHIQNALDIKISGIISLKALHVSKMHIDLDRMLLSY